jgi:hypothetical protein
MAEIVFENDVACVLTDSPHHIEYRWVARDHYRDAVLLSEHKRLIRVKMDRAIKANPDLAGADVHWGERYFHDKLAWFVYAVALQGAKEHAGS